jgi:TonB family protein
VGNETTSEARATTPELKETKSEVVPPVNASADAAVIERVLPEVPARARDTIQGTVKVAVRVDVDPSGAVKNAELEGAGSSKYFSRLALQAAQRWKFAPSNTVGQNASNTWTLRFQFARSGVTATPEQAHR